MTLEPYRVPSADRKSAQRPRLHAGPGAGLRVEGSGSLDVIHLLFVFFKVFMSSLRSVLVTFVSRQIAVAIIHTKKQTIVNNVTALPAATERADVLS
ncbi:hypothetical protein Mucpa_0247 [Mucilaginibacter paludis DSM 18603]|uniref:Uncharacterized protein n=1 Tax=Mucilaginibacter paludis DSM 18603 TaxID=714943 RepID=H1YFP4_9SPHI|nr:hypothetical protein Mucpa_0247 [Mucilaginibacter paludis DSM 18603]